MSPLRRLLAVRDAGPILQIERLFICVCLLLDVSPTRSLSPAMVKPWRPSRQKPKSEAGAAASSSTGTTRRAFGTTPFGRNLLASLRQRIVRRPKPPAITVAPPSPEAPIALAVAQTSPTLTLSNWGANGPAAPKPPPGSDDEESEESEDDELGHAVDGGGGSLAKKPKKKKSSKRPSFGFNKWVPKLLTPAEKQRDRVHRKKRTHVFVGPKSPPVIFTDSRKPLVELLARVLAFLDPLEPARVAAYVNKSTAVGVKAFYDLYCPPPRPRRYLVNRLLEDRRSAIPAKVMAWLPIADRVRASASCWSLYEASNALPLEFNSACATRVFLACYNFPRTSRIHKRFRKTPALQFSEANAEDVVNIVQLLERGGDGEEDDPDDDSDCFEAVREIALRKVGGLSAAKGRYFEQLLQTLFMGHVSSRLTALELTGAYISSCASKHLTDAGVRGRLEAGGPAVQAPGSPVARCSLPKFEAPERVQQRVQQSVRSRLGLEL
jgi:hypothetical protein